MKALIPKNRKLRVPILLVLLLAGIFAGCRLPGNPSPVTFPTDTPILVFPTLIPSTETPLPPSPTATVPPPTATETPVDTPTTAPTETVIPPTITPTVPVLQPGETYRIRFERGARSFTMPFLLNGAQQFVFRALANQKTTIAIFPLGLETIIWGGNGDTLYNNITGDYSPGFWHGTLPANQDYFIEVRASWEQPSVLSVVILPPGEASYWFPYTDEPNGFSLEYPNDFMINPDAPVFAFMNTPNALYLNLVDHTFYEKTNLGEAALVVGVRTVDASTPCQPPTDFFGEPLEDITIGGVTYQRTYMGDAGMGNIYESITHTTQQGDTCYEIYFFTHSSNIDFYDPSLGIEEYDREAILEKFTEILSRMQYLNP